MKTYTVGHSSGQARWSEPIEEDHRSLAAQGDALEAALAVEATPPERRAVLSGIIRTLWTAMGLHLRREREILFPALAQILGPDAGALTLLKRSHQELKGGHRHLAELLQECEDPQWDRVAITCHAFAELLEDHEKKTERLLLDVLEFNLYDERLRELAEVFREIAWRAHEREEERWPADWRERAKEEVHLDEGRLHWRAA